MEANRTMKTPHAWKARLLDGATALCETLCGRRALNHLAAYCYWRSRGENLDDPERNGEFGVLKVAARGLLGVSPVAVDVGANVGDWTNEFLRTNSGGRVYAFEPAAETFAQLRRRFAADGRIACQPLAISDRAGEARMAVWPDYSGSNSMHDFVGGAGMRMEKVETVTGDDVLRSHGLAKIDWLKIDVEGHEIQVLRGFRRSLEERRIRFVQWEYNKTWIAARTSLRDAFELLEPAGYKLCKLRPKSPLRYTRYRAALDNYCYSNWLAITEEDYPRFAALTKPDERTGDDW